MNYLDMIAKLGVGNAHPGGFASTLRLLARLPLHPGTKVLEVGCGTGRTSCQLAHIGCRVTGVDLHPLMLQKAAKRAKAEGVKVDFLQGAAEALPLEEGSFDLVFVESVTNFTDAPRSVGEYLRVLKPGGMLVDRELLASAELPATLAADLSGSYGIAKLRTAEEWAELFAAKGFADAGLLERSPVTPILWEDIVMYPDVHQQADKDIYQDPGIWETSRNYDELMSHNQEWFEQAVLTARKPVTP